MRRKSTFGRTIRALPLLIVLTACDIVALPRASDLPAQNTTPTLAPLLVATPEPTLIPLTASELLDQAQQQRVLGDYAAATESLTELLNHHPDAPEARAAHTLLGESYALRGMWSEAADTLASVTEREPHDEWYARALFWLARSHEQAGAWQAAIDSYERYRELDTPLAVYALMRQAAQERALGHLEAAAEHYVAVAQQDIARGERAGSYEKAIAIYKELERPDRALELYHELIEFANMPDYRTRILTEAIALAQTQGNMPQAQVWRQVLISELPGQPQALTALGNLLNDPSISLDAALVAGVYALHAQVEQALPYFDAAIAASEGDAALELRRQRAMALRTNGDFAGALEALAAIAAESPDSEVGRQAQLDWVQTLGQSGETEAAIAGYREFANAYIDDPRAPEALYRASILLARLGDGEGSNQQKVDLGRRFPASNQAQNALYEAAWYFYSAGRLAEAQSTWAANTVAGGTMGSQSAYWAGRAADQLGQSEARDGFYQQAFELAPDSYYGIRAAEHLDSIIHGTIEIGSPITPAEWRETEAWLVSWSGQPALNIDDNGFPAEISESPIVQRALGLQELGLQSDAIAEWNLARDRWAGDANGLYALARYAHEHDVPYIALMASAQLAVLSPEGRADNAPIGLRRMLFPTPYSSAVVANSQEFDLDPRAFYALMRQESLFNPGAISWAGARGLGQVMPTTALGIAHNLQMLDYDEADLLRPSVSIRFGTYYLSAQQHSMEGSLHGALAAYNGGLGNAQRWADGTVVHDPDMFTELIDYPETKGYIKYVYGFYGAYQRLYARP